MTKKKVQAEHAQGFGLLERGLMPELDPEVALEEKECP